MKKSKKIRKQKGGQSDAINYTAGGTDGDIGTFVEDVIGIVLSTVNTVVNTVDVVVDVAELPGDMGTAFTEKNPPKPSDINITGM